MRKGKAILVLDNTFTFGGAINSLRHLFRALDKSKFIPVLVTGQSQEFLKTCFPECISYHFVPKLSWIDNQLYRKVVGFSFFKIFFFRKLLNLGRYFYWLIFITFPEAFKYYRLGRKHEVALVHLNNILGSQLAGIIAAKFLRVPCVAHLRDFEAIHPITRFYARLIDYHVAISVSIKDNLLQLGVPAERISIVHDAVDLNQFNYEAKDKHLIAEFGLTPEQPRYGIFGRLVKWKGIREFIMAAAEVSRIMPEAKGFIVGDASDGDEEYFHEMQELCSKLGLKKKIIFTGYREDVSAMMELMNVIVHASIRPEPFGMVLIEGMAMKKPIVATRGGGVLDIVVDGVTGFLVKMENPEDLSQAIVKLLQHPDLCQKMGEAGHNRVKLKFSCHRHVHQMEDIYQRLTAKS